MSYIFLLISFIFDLENLYLDSLNFSMISFILFLERLIFVFYSPIIFINSSLDLFSKSLTPLFFAISFNLFNYQFIILIPGSDKKKML